MTNKNHLQVKCVVLIAVVILFGIVLAGCGGDGEVKVNGSTSTKTVDTGDQGQLKIVAQNMTYTGHTLKPAVTVTLKGKKLKNNKDYTLKYSDNINAGTGKITVKGKTVFKGQTIDSTFVINKANQKINVKSKNITLSPSMKEKTYLMGASARFGARLTYTSNNSKIIKVTNSSKGEIVALGRGTAKITIKATETKNVKSATSVVTVMSYVSSKTDISKANISVKNATYNDSNLKPAVTVTYDAVTVNYKKNNEFNKNASWNRTFNASSKKQSSVKNKPAVTEMHIKKTLVQDKDYTLTYTNNKNAGKGKVIVKGKGAYNGSTTRQFIIAQATQSFVNKPTDLCLYPAMKGKITSISIKKNGKTLVVKPKFSASMTVKSSNPSVIKVIDTSKGKIQPLKTGKATITITTSATKNVKAGKTTLIVALVKYPWCKLTNSKLKPVKGNANTYELRPTVIGPIDLGIQVTKGTTYTAGVASDTDATIKGSNLTVTRSGTVAVNVTVSPTKSNRYVYGQKTFKYIIDVKGLEKLYPSNQNGWFFRQETEGRNTVIVIKGFSGNATNILVPATMRVGVSNCIVRKLDDGTFKNNKKVEDIQNYNNGFTTIGNEVFKGCTALKRIWIPTSVRNIGNSAFDGCSQLRYVNLPDNITIIQNATFRGCSRLQSVVLPANTKTIGTDAFRNCTGLEEITIPATVKSIGRNAFANCKQLKRVYYGGSVVQWGVLAKQAGLTKTNVYSYADGSTPKQTMSNDTLYNQYSFALNNPSFFYMTDRMQEEMTEYMWCITHNYSKLLVIAIKDTLENIDQYEERLANSITEETNNKEKLQKELALELVNAMTESPDYNWHNDTGYKVYNAFNKVSGKSVSVIKDDNKRKALAKDLAIAGIADEKTCNNMLKAFANVDFSGISKATGYTVNTFDFMQEYFLIRAQKDKIRTLMKIVPQNTDLYAGLNALDTELEISNWPTLFNRYVNQMSQKKIIKEFAFKGPNITAFKAGAKMLGLIMVGPSGKDLQHSMIMMSNVCTLKGMLDNQLKAGVKTVQDRKKYELTMSAYLAGLRTWKPYVSNLQKSQDDPYGTAYIDAMMRRYDKVFTLKNYYNSCKVYAHERSHNYL